MTQSAGGMVVRASALGIVMTFCICHALGAQFVDLDDPEFGSKLGVAAMNALLMAIVFECAFTLTSASHRLTHATLVQCILHYVCIESAYWCYHTLQHTSPFFWRLTGHEMHHAVSADTLTPLDAWYLSAPDFVGWSLCALAPNFISLTRLHASQHATLLTILATALMVQHTPTWVACTGAGCIGHVIHHTPGRARALFNNGVNSLLLGV